MEEIRMDIRERESKLARGGEVYRDLPLEGQFSRAQSDHGQWRGARPFYQGSKRSQDRVAI